MVSFQATLERLIKKGWKNVFDFRLTGKPPRSREIIDSAHVPLSVKTQKKESLELLFLNEKYVNENYNDFMSRYSGFGEDLYSLLSEQLPEVFRKLTFYKGIVYQTEDSYAVFIGEPAFGIQLDPLIEVIVIWTHDDHIEIGYWWEDPCAEALRFIKDVILGK
ncbi:MULTISPECIES: hypothetical protein [unclassified Spirosoma]|uniref:hypothetical protein n=1 Tax=unclassified Spirosoma TaxID=2621999 RepID=UPI000964D3CA|nr:MULTISPECIES: hypothetical protein [unclassified Spirosoma]MBN8826567.1 hypothetical protein [Spirosoma sp.]OJW71582.1 MAG: hypothetical protein BGO59_26770 [Spirosoma sp. 48-14]